MRQCDLQHGGQRCEEDGSVDVYIPLDSTLTWGSAICSMVNSDVRRMEV